MAIFMKKSLIGLTAASLLASCTINFGSGEKPREHTMSEKAWLAVMVACNVADYYTTKHFLDEGAEEANPVYGKNPGDKKLMIGKLIGIGAFYIGGQFYPEKRELIYQIGAGVNCGAAVWNEYATKRY
jgi:purine-cytosine permease-like protein